MNESAALQLADLVRQTAFEAHTFLRHGHSEKVYENALRNRLRKKSLTVDQQVPISVYDEDGSLLGDFAADLVVNGKIQAIETTTEERDDSQFVELPRIGFEFNRRDYGRLRQLIEQLNSF